MMRTTLLLSALSLLFPSGSALPQSLGGVRIQTELLRGNVHLLVSRAGGNLAVYAGDDGVLLVDSDYAELSAKVEDALKKISDRPVRYVVNTHWHFDHVGGNEHFGETGATIVAHENVRKQMSEDRHIGIIERDVPASPAGALPSLTFRRQLTLHLRDEEVTLLHLANAHTDGDAVVLFRSANVIHAGDIVFSHGYPFIDITSGGSIDGLIAAVEQIVALCDGETRIVPGHGPTADRAGLEAYLAMLRSFREIISREIGDGKDLESILADRPTAALDEVWGRHAFSPAQFTEIVFRSLSEK